MLYPLSYSPLFITTISQPSNFSQVKIQQISILYVQIHDIMYICTLKNGLIIMNKCPYCGSINLKKSGFRDSRRMWQCRACVRKHTEGARLYKRPEIPVIKQCLHCGGQTKNPKFCSRSCSAIYSNLNDRERYATRKKNNPAKKYYCRECGVEVSTGRKKCDECHLKNPEIGGKPHRLVLWDNITLAEVADRASYQVHAHIRQRARYRYRKSSRPKYCVNCGYDKHIEICHIHAIADFPLETNVSEINDLKNLVALCPNCHWELDKGSLSIEEIRSKNNAID